MGLTFKVAPELLSNSSVEEVWTADGCYDPLHDDAQAMALVKKFRLLVDGGNAMWCVHGDTAGSGRIDDDLNRAIVGCVAQMRFDRTAPEAAAKGTAT